MSRLMTGIVSVTLVLIVSSLCVAQETQPAGQPEGKCTFDEFEDSYLLMTRIPLEKTGMLLVSTQISVGKKNAETILTLVWPTDQMFSKAEVPLQLLIDGKRIRVDPIGIDFEPGNLNNEEHIITIATYQIPVQTIKDGVKAEQLRGRIKNGLELDAVINQVFSLTLAHREWSGDVLEGRIKPLVTDEE